jgi:hypothetical protein
MTVVPKSVCVLGHISRSRARSFARLGGGEGSNKHADVLRAFYSRRVHSGFLGKLLERDQISHLQWNRSIANSRRG